MNPLSIIFYILLFFGICIFIVVLTALYNIVTKSFKPKNALAILITIVFLFLFNGMLALVNFNTAINQLRDSFSTQSDGSQKAQNNGSIF